MSLEKPNWFDYQDRQLYRKLCYESENWPNLTEQENEFIKSMYYFEQNDVHHE